MSIKLLIEEANVDLKKFDEIYMYYEKKLNYLIKNFKIEEYDSELTLKLWHIINNDKILKFNSDIEIDNYIYISLKNYCITLYNKQKKEKAICYNSDMLDIELNKIYYYSDHSTTKYVFEELIHTLNSRQQEILSLKYKDGFSDIEIAKQLKISRQAVHKNISKSLNILNKDLLQLKNYV